MKFKRLVTTLLTGFVAAASTSGAVLAADTVKVGGNFELTGAASAYGTPMSEGMQLAIEQANAKGGLLGKQLEAVIADNKTDKTEAAAVTTKLVEQKVVGIIGPATTGDALAELPVANDGKTPVVLPAATGNGITLDSAGKVLEFIYRVCFEDSYQGVAAANYTVNELNAKKVVMVVDKGNDYSQGLADAFKKQLEAKGGSVVAEESYQTNDTDFQTILTNVLAQDYDAIYLPGYYTEGGLIIKQARELGIDKPIVGGDGLHSETLVELAGKENLDKVYYTSHYSDQTNDPDVQAFVKAYEAKFGKKPNTFAALSYDATNVLLKAMETAGSDDPVEVNKALAQTKDFKGVTGTFSIDENHNPVKTAVIIGYENGELKDAVEVSGE